ncbi:DUF3566 domain-containing protein [Nakamurella endophytica]|uniref:DUF3566 domain-containing protein n=1 Tax=Nakamurella endophytica TaxID=1748367 RepID=A0A917SUP4_9ACTN|nr:DUF3566 domain-containing protein [Nakamurella endophytica]GGL97404.1 hypothetical protein GCM10011594_16470 [Nakamurella endophytica]
MTTPRATSAAQRSPSTVAAPTPTGHAGINGSAVGRPAAVPAGGRADRADAARRRGRGQRRPPRLASLQLKRVDPWTVLKISLIVAIVMFFVWMIAVGVLYLSLGSLDVWSKINQTWQTLTSADSSGNPSDLVTPQAVFSVTAVIGAINIVLFTALATIAAFVYNAAAGMSGGVEITLGERD